MDKKQEISNIANIIENETQQCNVDDCTQCQFIDGYGCLNLRRATALYNEGYRKADDVRKETERSVITRILCMIYKYFQDMDIDKSDIEQYTHTLDYMICKEFGLEVQDE